MNAQHEVDVGQEMTEREWTVAQTAWNQWDKERAAINHEFTVRHIALAGADDTLLRLEMSCELRAHDKAQPSMPRPGCRPGAARDLRPVPADHTGPVPYWGE